MKRIAIRSGALWLLVLILLGGLCFFLFEYFINSKQWIVAPGSPHIYNGNKIDNGVVVDRDGVKLMDASGDRTYSDDPVLRRAMMHWLGDRQGNISAPVVSTYAKEIAGYDLLTGLYSDGGGQAQLTLSSRLQLAALEAMEGRKGTVAMYNYRTGELLCALTAPNYDPDDVPDLSQYQNGEYEGVYMNRFTQSVYIPGSIFKIVTTAAALEEIEDIHEQTFKCTGTQEYGKFDVTCEKKHGKLTFEAAMAQSCNCAYAQIVEQLGAETLQKYVQQYNVTQRVSFDGVTTAAGNFDISDASAVQIAWSGIGQHKDQINPARYLTFMGAIANDGLEVMPHIMQRITNSDKQTYRAKTVTGEQIMSQKAAQQLQQMMRNNVVEKYGVDAFPDLTVCAKTGTAQVGGDKKSNAMFAGFVLDEDYPIAFFAAVEDSGYGREICIPIISKLLETCMEVL